MQNRRKTTHLVQARLEISYREGKVKTHICAPNQVTRSVRGRGVRLLQPLGSTRSHRLACVHLGGTLSSNLHVVAKRKRRKRGKLLKHGSKSTFSSRKTRRVNPSRPTSALPSLSHHAPVIQSCSGQSTEALGAEPRRKDAYFRRSSSASSSFVPWRRCMLVWCSLSPAGADSPSGWIMTTSSRMAGSPCAAGFVVPASVPSARSKALGCAQKVSESAVGAFLIVWKL